VVFDYFNSYYWEVCQMCLISSTTPRPSMKKSISLRTLHKSTECLIYSNLTYRYVLQYNKTCMRYSGGARSRNRTSVPITMTAVDYDTQTKQRVPSVSFSGRVASCATRVENGTRTRNSDSVTACNDTSLKLLSLFIHQCFIAGT